MRQKYDESRPIMMRAWMVLARLPSMATGSRLPSRDDGLLALLALLERRFKDPGLLGLLWRIVDAHHATPGKGLPIGALTSQNFANYYLSGLDRLLLEGAGVSGLVR